ncbi:MAG: class I SAM-dependent methyltransferase [Pseudomonadota bacterium]|nr:class I SAM-dependent methyltransferase [Pseudomonadota bacterium]MDP1905977.1 class I SAM-dependent methyltransferase [Pseudomonadota bacterium]MDP2351895.1 class I SAM-dependent methyltransferase [Pseudomonadota bacterium]
MEKDLIDWKTNAWQDPRMAGWYQQRMLENRGTNRLKNQVEVALCARHVAGNKLLDVGVGSGRASLPLARAGFDVTGVDSSQAMLDQTRAQAGETPIRLLQRDLADLKFADDEFDTVMSLNVLVHFPHWQAILAEWQRVLRPNGRIVFDIHSQDHEDAACAARGLPARPQDGDNFVDYCSRIRVADLVETATRLGLTLVAVIPYIGGNSNTWLAGTLADGPRFNRLLSWLVSDTRLYDFALFIEQEIYAHLSSRVTGRFMVVLDKRPDPEGNQAWLEHDRALNRALEGPLDFAALAALAPSFDADWRERLNAHLDWPRNRVLLYNLLSAWEAFPAHLDLASFLEPRHAEALQNWRKQAATDAATTRTLRDLAALPGLNGWLRHQEVPLAGGLEYDLTRAMLTRYFHAFD